MFCINPPLLTLAPDSKNWIRWKFCPVKIMTFTNLSLCLLKNGASRENWRAMQTAFLCSTVLTKLAVCLFQWWAAQLRAWFLIKLKAMTRWSEFCLLCLSARGRGGGGYVKSVSENSVFLGEEGEALTLTLSSSKKLS